MLIALIMLAAGSLLFWLIMPAPLLPLPNLLELNQIRKTDREPDIPLHLYDKEAKINA